MTPAGALGLLVLLIGAWFALLAWRNSRARRNGHFESVASAAARYRERVASPDLDGLEQHLGHSLPESFRALYRDRGLITSENIVVAVPNPLEKSESSYIAFFEPADIETLDHPWPGCEGLFPFANNGAGDQFLVDLTQPDPDVVYHLHETGEQVSLGVPLSAFIAAPRGEVDDD